MITGPTGFSGSGFTGSGFSGVEALTVMSVSANETEFIPVGNASADKHKIGINKNIAFFVTDLSICNEEVRLMIWWAGVSNCRNNKKIVPPQKKVL